MRRRPSPIAGSGILLENPDVLSHHVGDTAGAREADNMILQSLIGLPPFLAYFCTAFAAQRDAAPKHIGADQGSRNTNL
jgi:hypothetical protein